jgi:glycosyltransferase involved in cell wall biosynthesis
VDLWRLPSEKIVVIAEGVNVIFRPIAFTKDLRQRLNLLSGPYLLALGSLEPRKNLNRLLRAWEITQSQLPENLWLVLAGAKGTIFREAGLSSLPPRTHLTGYVPESALSALYSGALAFLYQSVYMKDSACPRSKRWHMERPSCLKYHFPSGSGRQRWDPRRPN